MNTMDHTILGIDEFAALVLGATVLLLLLAASLTVTDSDGVRLSLRAWAWRRMAPPRAQAMLRRRQVDTREFLEGNSVRQLRRAARRCEQCGQLETCDHVLASPPGTAADYAFCPNQKLMQRYSKGPS